MKFEVYCRRPFFRRKQWYWHLKGGNNEIIASGEGYNNWDDCMDAIQLVKQSYDVDVEQISPL